MTANAWHHIETWCQMVAGTLISQVVLALFGVPMAHALAITG